MKKKKKKRIQIAYRIDPEALKILKKTASERGIYASRALDVIILEWAEENKRKRLKDTKEAGDLSEIKKEVASLRKKVTMLEDTVNLLNSSEM